MSKLSTGEVVRKLNRLGTMSPGEVAHRARAKVYAELDRIGAGIHIGATTTSHAVPFRHYLAGAPSARFYRSHRENLGPFVQARFPQWIDRAVKEAERLCSHETTLLGHERVQLGTEIDWHRDPITGRTWERRYWADYGPIEESGGRDPKHIHELNRQQHLPRLAKAYQLTGEERYAREAVAQLNSWIDQNPPGEGVNWQSSLEIAIRTISWLWTIFLLLPSRSFDEVSAERIGASLFTQLEHIHRYLSRFSSPNTHLIGEAVALFLSGLVFRDQARPAVWLRESVGILAETAGRQVLEDGVYGELSSCYHCYALDFYLQTTALAQQQAFSLPEPISLTVQGMLHFLMHLTRPDGTLPLLGDDDGGRALALDRGDYGSFQDALCLGSLLFHRADFKHQAGAYSEQTLWLLGKDSVDHYSQLESMAPVKTTSSHSSAGYHLLRSGWGPQDSQVVFDCGGLGMLTGAHAHADALSITLFSGGREVLVDPGTFVYNCSPEWRGYFRSTRAHNTVTVDDRDQSEQGGSFSWRTQHSSRLAKTFTLPGVEYLEGEHDGYMRLQHGITHRRRLLCVPPDSWIVVDEFHGSGSHKFDFRYHLAPELEVSSFVQAEDGLSLWAEQAGLFLQLFADRPVDSQLSRGQTTPPEGWASRRYGQKQPCSLLRTTLAGSAPAAAITYLLRTTTSLSPAPDALQVHQIRSLKMEKGSGVACSHQHHGFEDITVLSTGDVQMEVAGFRLRGDFFWLRLEGGVLKQTLAVQASYLARGAREIFWRSEPGPYLFVS